MPRKHTDEGASALEARIGRLYAEPISSFVTARNALANELRREEPAASARVKALARPSIAAWAMNQVYWHARDEYDRLLAAGDELRRLQQQVLAGRGVDAREAAEVRQDAIRRVSDRAAAFLEEAGHPPSDTVRQRLAVTADAIAAFGSHPAGFTHGRLDKELEPPGFEALASLGAPSLRLVKSGRPAPSTSPAPPSSPKPAAARHAVESREDRDRRAREAEQQRARAEQEARRALEHAERELLKETNRATQAARDLRERELRVRELVTRRERLEQELARAQAAEAAAERDLQQARAKHEAAESTRAAAATAEASARAVLKAHTHEDA